MILGKALNSYSEPWVILEDSMERVKKGGYFIFSLENAFSYLEFVHILGQRDVYRREFVYPIPYEECQKQMEQYGVITALRMYEFILGEDEKRTLQNIWEKVKGAESDAMNFQRFITKKYVFIVKK